MFNTIINATSNVDLKIATQKKYEDKINILESDLRASVTPEVLNQALAIADKFKSEVALKYFPSENSIVNFSVVSDDMSMSYIIALSLNGNNICTNISKNVFHTHESQIEQSIRQSIAESIANAIPINTILNAMKGKHYEDTHRICK